MLSEPGQDAYVVVGEAGDGETAIELAERLRPDLVIMDVKMPVLDGISAAERISPGRLRPVRLSPVRLSPVRPGRTDALTPGRTDGLDAELGPSDQSPVTPSI